MKMKWMAAAALGAAALVLALVPSAEADSIVGSKHDFKSTGTSTYKGTTDETCVYCHTPHNASVATPLWNHTSTTESFTLYSSTTLNATPGQPAGVSKMCLSCHDGSIAIDAIVGKTAGTTKITTGTILLGTDLSNDHPISITYVDGTGTGMRTMDAGNKSVTDASSNKLPLYGTSQVECASCHNPHDNANTKFLRMSNTKSALCLVCHTK